MSNPTSGTSKSASTRPKMVRELKFNLHDKSSESFVKTNEAIITTKINFTIFRQSELKFKEQWVKAFALIWDSFCSREVCMAIKGMPDFESVISNDPLFMLGRAERLMCTTEKAKYPSLTLIEVFVVG